MRRAAVSIASSIAAGQGRLDLSEYWQFPGISRGSNFELRTQLELARVPRVGDGKPIDEAGALSLEAGKTIFAILDKTKGRQEERGLLNLIPDT